MSALGIFRILSLLLLSWIFFPLIVSNPPLNTTFLSQNSFNISLILSIIGVIWIFLIGVMTIRFTISIIIAWVLFPFLAKNSFLNSTFIGQNWILFSILLTLVLIGINLDIIRRIEANQKKTKILEKNELKYGSSVSMKDGGTVEYNRRF